VRDTTSGHNGLLGLLDEGLSQSQLARRMKTSQSYIARIEGGKVRPSTDALERFAQATRTRLRIVFEPKLPGERPGRGPLLTATR
jgi:transcriptional regulator with XRE-family HTH domain